MPAPERGATASDGGTGLIGTLAGVVVFLVFLLFAVQLLFSLYAASTVTAVANDAVLRAAAHDPPPLEDIEGQARSHLGRAGDRSTFVWSQLDSDADGVVDTVSLAIVTPTPRLLPSSLSSVVGADEVRRTVRARIERVDG